MRLFVDTSAWLALNDKGDQCHEQAVAKSLEIKTKRIELITSEYVLDESITLIRYRVSHRAAVFWGDSLFKSSIVKVLDVTDIIRSKAWEMFKRYDDKEFSFTDCTSFVLIRNLRLPKAFTFDEDFRQMGIEIF